MASIVRWDVPLLARQRFRARRDHLRSRRRRARSANRDLRRGVHHCAFGRHRRRPDVRDASEDQEVGLVTDRALGLVLDTTDPRELAPFWATALGYVVVADVDNYVLLMPADGV